ncbi:GDP-mannose transporter GONST3 [Capsicum annuum]|uniref:GDP-mannose transporter GONST3 n=1 Tax=Capsicum annuum TaxID=4072 RepID=A0A2G2ZCK7_CAPAN|nr:GDP-mannose transporter GONST3 [Capsicum annuum]
MGEQGYKKTSSDHCIFAQSFSDNDFIILLLYVDGMLIMGKNASRINELKKQLCKYFAMKDLGHAKQILGMRITRLRDERKLYLSQEKYIEHVLEHFNMKNTKVVNTLLAGHMKLSRAMCPTMKEEKESITKVLYSSIVRSLMYAMIKFQMLWKILKVEMPERLWMLLHRLPVTNQVGIVAYMSRHRFMAGETLYLHQPWPAMKTWLSFGTIFAGSVLYVSTDYQFTLTAYSWAVAYLVCMSIDFVYIKHTVMTISLNTWGLVLYNNLEALLLFPIELLIMGELKKIKHEIDQDESDRHSFQVVLPVALSCLFGLAISFFGFSCRRAISATGFTVLGIVNKLLTVVINLVIWDKHSKLIGTVGLLICMSGGVMYQQSTSNKPKAVKDANARVADEEEQQKLLEMQSNTHSSDSQKQDTESADRKQ